MNKKLLSIKKAKKILFDNALKIKKSEIINLENSEGRVLAENIYSNIDLPEENNSALDGFAFDYRAKKNVLLTIGGVSLPGKPFLGKIKKNQVIKVFTGAYIIGKKFPFHNTVVMEEDCDVKGNLVFIKKYPAKGSNIRKQGEDLKKKKLILKKGYRIRTVDLAQLASIGKRKIKVFVKLKVGIFSTGNELIDHNSRKKKFCIYDSNKLVLISLFKKLSCDVHDLGIIQDNIFEAKEKIIKNANKFELIVTSGGISSSEQDKISDLLNRHGEIKFWRLAIKPGRPIAYGKINNTPFIGLPGNPVAAVITFFMILSEYIKKISGIKVNNLHERKLPSSFQMKKKIGRTEWLRGSIKLINNKQYIDKFKTSGSGIISSITNSDGIIEIDENVSKITKGTLLKFYKFEDFLN